jgi:hypothetical protein
MLGMQFEFAGIHHDLTGLHAKPGGIHATLIRHEHGSIASSSASSSTTHRA